MKILIVGGTGNISWRIMERALQLGYEVTILNRGGTGGRIRREPLPGCRTIIADIRDTEMVNKLLKDDQFDVVVDMVCYNADHAKQAISLFADKTKQYIFISTTGLYDRRIATPPFTETEPILNDGWPYAVSKAAAEQVFIEAWRRQKFPVTIIRAGHTYDTIVPVAVGDPDWTVPQRLLQGKPIAIHGDGTTLWTLTHSKDFARGVIAMCGLQETFGEAIHITSDIWHTWRQITDALCKALRVSQSRICYRTTDEITNIDKRLGDGILWHKMWCDIYDITKFRKFCPSWRPEVSLEQGMAWLVDYFQNNPQLLSPNESLNRMLDILCRYPL